MEEILQYVLSVDINGNLLDGSKNYKIHLPGNIPSNLFWSIIVYDTETKLIIKTDQSWPSIHSQNKNLKINDDGSIDVFFRSDLPIDEKNPCIKTIPEKKWYLILRIYGVKETNKNINWKPGEIEVLN